MNQPANHNAFNRTSRTVAFSLLKKLPAIVVCLIFLVIAAGCASTEVTSRERLVTGKLPRPSKILIYDFVATPADVPDSSAAGKAAGEATAQTPEEIEAGRQLGASIATQLAQQINDMGLQAEKATPQTKPQLNDIVIRGYLQSVFQGDSLKRVVVGFGYGSSELETAVEGYQMTAQGLRKLGSGKIKSVGNKTPGGAVGAVTMIANANPAGLIVGGVVKGYGEISGKSKVEGLAKSTTQKIAEQLQIRFKEEGWIK
ncbi:MAG: DUF4410 domain-containing protein [Victivallaceae bacterium]